MKKFLFTLCIFAAFHANAQDEAVLGANDFEFQYGNTTLIYTIIDEQTCQTKAGFYTSYTDNKPGSVTYGNTVNGAVEIPATVTDSNTGKEYTVVKIGSFGFNNISSITLPSTVVTIDEYAFINDDALTAIDLSGVTSIGNSAFYDCAALASVILPEGLPYIGDYLFSYCHSLQSVNLPSSITSIGNSSFISTGITSADIPEGVTTIGPSAFSGCAALTSVSLPTTLTSIGQGAFSYCNKLNEIILPSGLSQIGSRCFWNCNNLTDITIDNFTPPSISYDTFPSSIYGNATLWVYKTALTAYSRNSVWGNFSSILSIPVAATGISLSQSVATVSEALSITLTATVDPVYSTDPVVWSSSNENVVAVTQEGKITGRGLGQATVTVTCGNYTAECIVTVTTNPSESVTVSSPGAPVYVGDVITMKAVVKPATITSPVTWASSNPDVAEISASTGYLTALSPGSTLITATCSNVTGKYNLVVNPIDAREVLISTDKATLQVGGTVILYASVLPDNTTYPEITWTTNDDNVATVSNGIVTATGVGNATITASCGYVTATCDITVEPTPAENVNLNFNEVALKPNQTLQLLAEILPETTTDKTVVWSSSSADVASVDQSGLITALTVGETTITATCGDVTAKCVVTVEPILATEVVLNAYAVTLQASQIQLLVATVGDDVTVKTITWMSDNEAVATVSDGLVTAVSVGEAVITASCGAVSASCYVTVVPTPVTLITLDNTAATINVGEILVLNATVYPADATDTTVNWSSDNEAVATVNTTGEVKALSQGLATITAAIGDVFTTCNVTVLNPAQSVILNYTALEMTVGQTVDLIATITPENTTDALAWSSSNTDVASVNEYGIVEAHSEGSAVITAQCGDVTATCTVNVSENPTVTPDEPENPEDPGTSGLESVIADKDGHYNVYTVSGVLVMSGVTSDKLSTLAHGLYIINGKKVYVK